MCSVLASEVVVEFCAASEVQSGVAIEASVMVGFADFDHGPMETPMTETTLPLIELLQEQDDGDFLRSVAGGGKYFGSRAL